MKKCSSVVWKFFDRIVEDKRCVAVLCKLCETQYKYFGNTTNLRVHLSNRHPIQWELGQTGALDESKIRIVEDGDSISSPTSKRRRYRRSLDKNVDVLENSDDQEENDEATINLVRQMHADQNTDEEWLEEDPYVTHIETYEPKQKRKKMKYRTIKREVSSPTSLPGFYVAPNAESTIVHEAVPRKDEYSVFGEYVGDKLRKFKNPRTRGNLQQLITTLIWQAEYGMYDSVESVKRVLLYSVQSPEQSTVEYDTQVQEHTEVIVQRDDINQSNEIEELEVIKT